MPLCRAFDFGQRKEVGGIVLVTTLRSPALDYRAIGGVKVAGELGYGDMREIEWKIR